LIVSQVFWALYFISNAPLKLEPIQSIIRDVLLLFPLGFILLVFMDYFRHYRLKVLQLTTLAILVTEALNFTGGFINHHYQHLPKFILYALGAVWAIARIGWLIFLFLPDRKNYPGLVMIRLFAFGFLLFLLPGIPLLLKSANSFTTHQLLSITYGIPYFFVIGFAMGIPAEQVTAVDERAGVVDGSGSIGG
jgi:hypothetical protein